MVFQLQELQETESTKPNEDAKNIVCSIISEFENDMNNDLDFKHAFDNIFKAISQLNVLRKKGKLSVKDATSAFNALEKIDKVLKVIF